MKRNARLMRGMTPDRRIDALELLLMHLTRVREANFFGSLVTKNRDAKRAIERLEKAKAACLSKAAAYSLDSPKLDTLADALLLRLKAVPPPSTDDEDLLDIIKLSIQVPLVSGADALSYSKLFFVDITSLDNARAEVESARVKLGSLQARHISKLSRMGYSSRELGYLVRPDFRAPVQAVVEREKRALEAAVEELILQRDHLLAELTRQSLSGKEMRRLKNGLKGLRPKVTRLLSLWTWWRRFVPAEGNAPRSWEAEAEVSIALLLGKAGGKARGKKAAAAEPDGEEDDVGGVAGAASSFPWDSEEVGAGAGAGAGGRAAAVPRSLLLEHINIRAEIERSWEEVITIGPSGLRRSIEYFERYLAGLRAAEGRASEEVSRAVGIMRPAESASAGPRPASGGASPAEAQAAALSAAKGLFLRVELARREVDILQRVKQGEYAKSNWDASGVGLDEPQDEAGESEQDAGILEVGMTAVLAAAELGELSESESDSESDESEFESESESDLQLQ